MLFVYFTSKIAIFYHAKYLEISCEKGFTFASKKCLRCKNSQMARIYVTSVYKNQIFNLLYLLIFHIFSHKKSQTFWKVWKSLCIKNQIPMICSNGSAGSSSSSKISISVSLELDFSSLFSSVSSTELVVLVFSITI